MLLCHRGISIDFSSCSRVSVWSKKDKFFGLMNCTVIEILGLWLWCRRNYNNLQDLDSFQDCELDWKILYYLVKCEDMWTSLFCSAVALLAAPFAGLFAAPILTPFVQRSLSLRLLSMCSNYIFSIWFKLNDAFKDLGMPLFAQFNIDCDL